ncbi:MAG TPA: helix-turn-helix transcriptional regulator [Candidatus Polarisedimenticolaceae bacterium]|nr:helix-turn-helix transcriptional regulator [Candidatus Polarisedimenticolaceae bacterium]
MTRNSSTFEIGPRLAAIRAGRGLSQGTTARLAGLAPAYLSRIETSRVHPSFTTVMRVLEALHADLDDLHTPDSHEPHRHPVCPVSARGDCLLQLIRGSAEVTRADGREAYSPREINILRSLAVFMRTGSPERVRAVELLLAELLDKSPGH